MRYCPRCYLTDEDLGSCGNFAVGCPAPVEAAPELVAHIACSACEKVVGVPVANIMRGKLGFLSNCQTDRCPAKLILPGGSSTATTLPAPLTEAAAPVAANAIPQGASARKPTPPSKAK